MALTVSMQERNFTNFLHITDKTLWTMYIVEVDVWLTLRLKLQYTLSITFDDVYAIYKIVFHKNLIFYDHNIFNKCIMSVINKL